MAEITAQLVEGLRERTQAGMSDCKVRARRGGAATWRRPSKSSSRRASPRAPSAPAPSRPRARCGRSVSGDAKSGVLVEVNIQTDFAARNDKFKTFVGDVTKAATDAAEGANLDELDVPGHGQDGRRGARRAHRADRREDRGSPLGQESPSRRPPGAVHSYVHLGGKIGVLLEVAAESAAVASHPEFKKFIDDAAMQIAAMNPHVPDARRGRRGRRRQAARDLRGSAARRGRSPSPKRAWPKIIEGKLNKWYSRGLPARARVGHRARLDASTRCAARSAKKRAAPSSSSASFASSAARASRRRPTTSRPKSPRWPAADGMARERLPDPAGGSSSAPSRSISTRSLFITRFTGSTAGRGSFATRCSISALTRLEELARAFEVPLTLFVIGSTLEREAPTAPKLRALADTGPRAREPYLRPSATISRGSTFCRDAAETRARAERHRGSHRHGARSGFARRVTPSPTSSWARSRTLGFRYDSSVFPCPSYWAAKACGHVRHSAARAGDRTRCSTRRSVLRAPTRPYRIGHPYWKTRGRPARAAHSGDPRSAATVHRYLAHHGRRQLVARQLTRTVVGRAAGQPRAARHRCARRRRRLGRARRAPTRREHPASPQARDARRRCSKRLRDAGHRFVRLDEAARRSHSALARSTEQPLTRWGVKSRSRRSPTLR